MTIIPHRLVKTLAFAIVIAAIIASTGLVPALDATGGTASASAEASTPASTAEDGLQPQSQSKSQPRSVVIGPAETAPGAMTSQKTLREGAVTSVEIAPPQAIPTQPNPSQPVFTITNTDTQSVTVWITHEGTSVDTKTDSDSDGGSADLQYRDAETGERLSGADVTVTLEPGEERVVGVVADAGASDSDSDSDSASNATAGVASSAITTTTTATANVHVRQTGAGVG